MRGGRLKDDVAGFLYDGDYMRGYNSEARSVVEIMALGPLRVHIIRDGGGPTAVISSPESPDEKARSVMVETGGRATVLFVPEQFEEHLLRSMLEPSKDIDEKYLSYTFVLDSGKVITGMIVEETPETIQIVIDPLAKDSATVLQKDEIEQRQKSNISLMPQGLLDKLSREEILDLLAYAYAKGDQQHKLFMEHQDH